jgi:hypothetical protein
MTQNTQAAYRDYLQRLSSADKFHWKWEALGSSSTQCLPHLTGVSSARMDNGTAYDLRRYILCLFHPRTSFPSWWSYGIFKEF